MAVVLRDPFNPDRGAVSASKGLVSGILAPNGEPSLFSEFDVFSVDGINYRVFFKTVTLGKVIPSDASLGFGQDLFTLPAGLVESLGFAYSLTSLCPSGLSATAGEFGLGTTVASGAVAVLSGTAGFENVAEGRTLSNHVAATTLVTEGFQVAPTYTVQSATVNPGLIDASAGTTKVYANIAAAWDQTGTETFTFQINGSLLYRFHGADFGVF